MIIYIILNRLLVKRLRYDSKKSRLVREDDNDLCDDDIRINMQVNTAASDMEKRREAFNAALQDEGKVVLDLFNKYQKTSYCNIIVLKS